MLQDRAVQTKFVIGQRPALGEGMPLGMPSPAGSVKTGNRDRPASPFTLASSRPVDEDVGRDSYSPA
jgi:hypothetical protein